MNAQQAVFRVRRNYNQWVANETLEDYALRFTAKRARRWSAARVSQTALGAISFLALEAIGGAITLSYGFTNAVWAIAVVGLIIFLTGIPITYHASKQGVDIDLLTRGAGFGYIGSTITSLIYATFTFIFFALEAAIMALALELTLGIPLTIGYFISAIVVIPLVTHGITLISRFQVWTQPVWILLQITPLICIAVQADDAFMLWTNFESGESGSSGFNILAFGAASAVVFSLIAQIGEQVDFLRFMPVPAAGRRSALKWWGAMMAAGPGWIIVGSLKILIGSFLAILALSHGVPIEQASDPNRMYLTAFSYVTSSPELTLVLVGGFVIISQLKINVTNAYAGSIAWSNFFSRLTHNHPGRVVWLVFNVTIALMLMELGIYRVLEDILSVFSILALAWVGSLVADLVINRTLKLRPQAMEFRRAHLYDINPVGVGSMLGSSTIGFLAFFGLFGELAEALATYITLGCTFLLAPGIALLTKGRFYIAREADSFAGQPDIACCICGHRFEPEDMSRCPAYGGPICSLCCSLDTRCEDMCKSKSRLPDQLNAVLARLLPASWLRVLNSRFGNFIAIFVLTSIVIGCLLALVYFQITLDQGVGKSVIANALINVFFIQLIVSGVVAWMFVLVHESRQVALEESRRQTGLLMAEIDAHTQTDLALQQAKEKAEAANSAKSRYLTGISHELRSPLNAILGYAQLLEKDTSLPLMKREALGVIRRSSEYLADLIEGLLDISRIEAGRLELIQKDVNLPALLDQLVSMLQVQANAKGIGFEYERLTPLPDMVRTDEKRLRQILLNLLSNALKYTQAGSVRFQVRYRNQVAEFSIIDTGVGISEQDMDRIFRPFERIHKAGDPYVTGTGLGLTITRLLTDIMGGDIAISSEPGKGSTFRVSLMLSSRGRRHELPVPQRVITGYEGPDRTIIAVDDEPAHRALLFDLLTPLGFNVIQAPDAVTCLDMLQHGHSLTAPIFLLDVSMPGMSGWDLAAAIREGHPAATILMISANAHEQPPKHVPDGINNGYLVKPLNHYHLLEQLAQSAGVRWCHDAEPSPTSGLETRLASTSASGAELIPLLSIDARQELIELARIGYLSAIRQRLEMIEAQGIYDEQLIATLRSLTLSMDFESLITLLGGDDL
ncbi:hybrid sensor histidine kinase/response regulator [Allohahella marinimesophila]|uniref:histidine kinase n=1 Tax=Allohahella marinimesophila TaxID=1054972 RepID=A0ABP7NHR7_9GAMM